MNLKNGKVRTSKFVGTGPSSYEKRIYRAAVSQKLRNTGLERRIRKTLQANCVEARGKYFSFLYSFHVSTHVAVRKMDWTLCCGLCSSRMVNLTVVQVYPTEFHTGPSAQPAGSHFVPAVKRLQRDADHHLRVPSLKTCGSELPLPFMTSRLSASVEIEATLGPKLIIKTGTPVLFVSLVLWLLFP